jgi:dihydrodiol dehydrogenase / D-xylose 1-dehydrogenase (NADP)
MSLEEATNAPGLRWGIIGTGQIAKKFAIGLQSAPTHTLQAVGSRSAANAAEFGDRFEVPTRHTSYEALVNDPNVDAVYVGTPHPDHVSSAMLAMQAGKAVLCEKPLTVNTAEAKQLIEYSRANNVFLMEAMWPRFQPSYYWIREQIANGVLGDIRLILAEVGWNSTFNPHSRMYAPELAGGILLDGGVYPVSFASQFLGTPNDVQSFGTLGQSNVDEQSVISMKYDNGALASIAMTIQANPLMSARICGTEGTLALGVYWWPDKATLHLKGKEPEVHEFEIIGNGYQYEAFEVARGVANGWVESPLMTHDESISIMETMDALRVEWGVRYPFE